MTDTSLCYDITTPALVISRINYHPLVDDELDSSDFEFIENIFEVCSYYQSKEYLIFIITNQAGIAKGYYTFKDFEILKNVAEENTEALEAIDQYRLQNNQKISDVLNRLNALSREADEIERELRRINSVLTEEQTNE